MDPTKIKNMEEFAKVSGISRPTVSKYFHDPDSVRASTREKIEQALETYDFRPNLFAVNQNRKLTKNVGIVVPYLTDPFFAEIARNMEAQVLAAGYQPALYSGYGDPKLEVEILDAIRGLKPAGVLIAPMGRLSDRAALDKFCAEVPTVLLDSFLPDTGLAFVGSDNRQFAGLMVEYLCRTGEPPCFFEMATPANPNANRRRQGYLDAMERLGHEPVIFKAEGSGWNFEEIGRAEGHRALTSGAFTTNTVLCSNDRLAIGMLNACYELGMRVGRGVDAAIRLAGQDDHPYSRFTCPSLTTIAQDYAAISRRAAETLFAAIEADEKKGETVFFEGRLVMRDSA